MRKRSGKRHIIRIYSCNLEKLVEKHNEILGNKIIHLDFDIARKKIELKQLKAEIKRHEAHLELKEAKKHA